MKAVFPEYVTRLLPNGIFAGIGIGVGGGGVGAGTGAGGGGVVDDGAGAAGVVDDVAGGDGVIEDVAGVVDGVDDGAGLVDDGAGALFFSLPHKTPNTIRRINTMTKRTTNPIGPMMNGFLYHLVGVGMVVAMTGVGMIPVLIYP